MVGGWSREGVNNVLLYKSTLHIHGMFAQGERRRNDRQGMQHTKFTLPALPNSSLNHHRAVSHHLAVDLQRQSLPPQRTAKVLKKAPRAP